LPQRRVKIGGGRFRTGGEIGRAPKVSAEEAKLLVGALGGGPARKGTRRKTDHQKGLDFYGRKVAKDHKKKGAGEKHTDRTRKSGIGGENKVG